MNQSYTDIQKQIADLQRASAEQAIKEKLALKQQIEKLATDSPYTLKDILNTRTPKPKASPVATKQPTTDKP